MEKIYHTIVLGIPENKQDTIRAKLLRIENAKNEAKVKVDESGQSAVTHYRIIQNSKLIIQNTKNQKGENINSQSGVDISLLECRIETGRTHQIRVHMAHIGHPVLADRAYGDISINSYINRNLGISRQLLHARSLSFIHPKTQKKLIIEAPYPTDFTEIITL